VVAHGSSTLLACAAGLVGTGMPFVYLSIGDPRYWAGSRLRQLRAGWLIRRAAAVVALTPGARDVLLTHYGLDRGRVHVIPNGRSGVDFAPADAADKAAARGRLGVSEAVGVVAIVGALSPEKRVDLAIDAVSLLADVVLLVAGDGTVRASLEDRAARVAPGRVRFLGATDTPADVLAAADALVLASDSEGLPGVLIEAGLAGLPVVATDVGWVRDVVRPGITGVIVPAGQAGALADGIRDALARRDEMGAAGRRHCLAEYEMGAVTDEWLDVLLDISLPN
jgi:glycosyltransferase involved in cell wall biosynthesis